jgi:hypothetical protein
VVEQELLTLVLKLLELGLVSVPVRKMVAVSGLCFGDSGTQPDGLMKTVESGFIVELIKNNVDVCQESKKKVCTR